MASVKRWRQLLLGMAIILYVTTPVYAFTPSQLPLLSAAAVPPNVMLQVDNSGSMDTVIYDAGYNPSADYGDVYFPVRSCFFFCSYSAGNIVGGGGDYAFYGSLNQNFCSGNQVSFYRNSSAVTCLSLPDPALNGETRYPINYLAYLVRQTNAGAPVTVVNSTRMKTAIAVANNLVDANRTLRIGLATFNPPQTTTRPTDPGPSGKIQQKVDDISSTTTAGVTNYNALKAAISALTAEANTPLAETYYQVTRYFRGLAPDPSYTGAPTTFTSPIQYRCQRNAGVVITDGLPTYDRTFPTNDPDDPNGLLPNWDKSSGDDGTNPPSDGEGGTLYLDDIAQFAYDIDMQTSTSTPSKDLAGKSWDTDGFVKQNLRTYTVGFTADNAMLSKAAVNGLGKYYLATDSATLSTALTAALSDISSKSGSGGAGASSSSTLTTGTYYYQTLYDPIDWRGIILAFPFTSTGAVGTTPAWTTNTTMKAGSGTTTYQSWNTASNAAIALLYDNFSPAQQAVLNSGLPTNIKGTDLVEWSKGTNKAGLRVRSVLLGDIINSPLTYASAKDQTASDLIGNNDYTDYLAIKGATNGMTPSLVVNANDGFTNIITASSGSRRYAYLPSTALAGLATVADTGYVNGTSHRFLNDGQITIADAQLSGAWKTLVLGGTGGAGRAFYALQLFDKTAGNVIRPLWEIRAPDTPNAGNALNDLGYAYAKPEVARLPDGTWAAFISNGYGSNSGVAALYVFNLATGAFITKLLVNNTDTDNGLSSVKLRVNASNIVQSAYAGDLKGRMWKFDLSSPTISNWGLAFSGRPLFTTPGAATAVPAAAATESITAQPLLLDQSTSGKMVFFGSGKFNETADKTSSATQRFYAVWDSDGGAGNYTIANLQPQSITGTFTANGDTYMTTSENKVNYTSQKGWYIPLVYGSTMIGERVINPAVYTLGRILFTTAGVDSKDPCSTQGFGKFIELDATSGAMLNYPVLDTNGDGKVDGSDLRSSGMLIGTGIPTLNALVDVDATANSAASQRKVLNDSGGNIKVLVEKGASGGGKGRIMWRQLQ
nr:PilC/PilY family type IV pilus protein [uncultured Pseudomonas sp.]